MAYENIKQIIIDSCRKMQAEGLIHGTSGNISIKIDDNTVAISPSSIPYDVLTVDDIPLVDINGNVIEGSKKPSSETPMHTAIYRARKDVKAIVHCHAIYSTVFSTLGYDCLPLISVPSLFYEQVKVAPFFHPGTKELADAAVEGFGEKGSAVILKNHGLISACDSIEKAMTCCSYIEETAQITCLALQITKSPAVIDEKSADMLHQKALKGEAL